MADFIHLDAAVDTDSAEPEAMATVKVVDSNNVPGGASLFTSQRSTSNPDFTLSSLKSHLVQNLIKKTQGTHQSFTPISAPPFTPALPPLHLSCIPHTCIKIYTRLVLLKQGLGQTLGTSPSQDQIL